MKIINQEHVAGFRIELAHLQGKQRILKEIWNVQVDAKTGHIDFRSDHM